MSARIDRRKLAGLTPAQCETYTTVFLEIADPHVTASGGIPCSVADRAHQQAMLAAGRAGVAPRPPFDRMSGLTGSQLSELQRWEAARDAAKKTPERIADEKEARDVGLDDEEIARLSDRDLKEAIRRHKLSDGHGKDAKPYPPPLPPRKRGNAVSAEVQAQIDEFAANMRAHVPGAR